MKNLKWKTILFDVDGTLLETIYNSMQGRNATLEHFGFPAHDEKQTRLDISYADPDFLTMGIPEEHRKDPGLFEKMFSWYNDYQVAHNLDVTYPFPGAVEAVNAAYDTGAALAVLSNKSDHRVKELCEHFFPGKFAFIRGSVAGTYYKPDPRLTRLVLDAVGGDPASAVLVGDSNLDVASAHNANLPCIAVTWGYRARDLLVADGPDYLADTPEQLIELLTKD